MNTIKIGLITDSIRSDNTGIGNYAKAIIEELRNKKGIRLKYIDYKKTSYNSKNLLLISNPFKILRIYLWHFFLPFRLRNYQFDYIFNFNAVPHFLPYKQKEIFFVHDISLDIVPTTHPLIRVLYHKIFFRFTIHYAYMIIANSQHTKKTLIQYHNVNPNKIFVLEYDAKFISRGKTQLVSKITKPFILNVNTIEPRKNINVLILAFKKLKDQYDIPHKLVICGKKGWKYKTTIDLIRKTKDVVYLGYVSDEYRNSLYQDTDLFVYPSLYEGFGIPIVEAMSYGCPIITSKNSNLTDLIGNAGVTVNPRLDELSEAIYRVLTSEQLLKKMSIESTLRLKEYYNSISIKTAILNLIDNLKTNA